MKRFLASVLFLFITCSCFSQELNQYKYVVVPYKFDFLKKHDKYRVNTLVRHLFKKEGFEVLYDNEDFPAELGNDRCMALYADINNESSIFMTKTSIVLRDCSNQIVLETPFGRTKVKEYAKAYNLTIRSAFEAIEAKNYSYQPKEKKVIPPPPPPVVVEETSEKVTVSDPTSMEPVTFKEGDEEVVEVQEVEEKEMATTESKKDVLYAQPIENGYQLVDSTPKVVMILLKSGVPNVYLVKGQDATVYKENGKWILSKTSGNGTKKKVLNVKF
ncbi:hypothetical protein KORDIASMS9_00092 [Kordia sp. SMS9]|uniref:hypothetical protein n=1 Tax=Kordia sp. SMS9 TaxID=2282170 RepID=UPI000E0DA7CB|nr:hypothetical protein [Kordia sp. SMS9]AXG67910.1 hypothetical protein KORDIASMS9_00092 [Kordia sp. SMS9]